MSTSAGAKNYNKQRLLLVSKEDVWFVSLYMLEHGKRIAQVDSGLSRSPQNRQLAGIGHGGITIGGNKISDLRFSDDTTLTAASQKELVALLNILEQHSAAYGINYKTKVMIVDREHDNHREINCENEIRRRTQQARVAMTKFTKIWRDHNITKATKMTLVQSLVFSIFLYASETSTVKKAHRAPKMLLKCERGGEC
ncbi:unnamed protein product [Callosobruchus maculatus]|uniref:Reverse transcriptase domain-containing protein n=1 Tax=Callosobruchus maculatus TaxID=64391 RepID=A0A653BK87_CALMS|nr:unnamed protein product [Callosobruchus maculatus]